MSEMPNSGEDHGHAQPVGGGDDVLVFHRATRLDDGGGAGGCDRLEAIGEREEGVGGGHGAGKGEHGLLRAEFGGIDAAHLACADADGLAVARVDDGVRLDVFADAPGKEQVAQLLRGRADAR